MPDVLCGLSIQKKSDGSILSLPYSSCFSIAAAIFA